MDPRESIVYQIWPRSFCDSNGDGVGDLRGVIGKLDYLRELGVDTVWLSPIFPSPNNDYGYDISDYRAVNPEFGAMEDFEALVAQAKARGIRILLDLVPNHTSDQHAWFRQALENPASKYRDYYIFRTGKNGGPPNNWMSFFGGSAWTKDERSGEYYLTSFTPQQCDLNWENPELRQEMYSMMRFWMDKGISGFRIDVVNLLKKPAGLPDKDPHKRGLQFPGRLATAQPGIHDMIREMNEEVFSKYPDCLTVGEGCLVGLEDVPDFTDPARRELTMMFHFDLATLGCGPLGKYDFRKLYRFTTLEFKRVTDAWQLEMQLRNGWVGNYLSNHDQPRQLDRFGSVDEKYRRASAKALCLYNMTQRGTPFIYQGEECGMTNLALEPEEWKDFEAHNSYRLLQSMMHLPKALARTIVKRVSRDNARTPVQWDGSRNAGFTTGTPWLRVNPNHKTVNIQDDMTHMDSIVGFYKRAIALRKEHSALVWGEYAPVDRDNPSVIAYTRAQEGGEKLLVVINLTGKGAKTKLPEKRGAECLLYTHSSRPLAAEVYLLPYEGLVYKL
ncbi:MAG TPA: alpha-glucosidase [Clostridia bacterium]|nr:alpha-glucosidase [Clostridia bacterium]